jgi:hypothetical protein
LKLQTGRGLANRAEGQLPFFGLLFRSPFTFSQQFLDGNAILTPPIFDRFKLTVLGERFLPIDGVLQNQDGVISVKIARIAGLPQGAAAASHDFY